MGSGEGDPRRKLQSPLYRTPGQDGTFLSSDTDRPFGGEYQTRSRITEQEWYYPGIKSVHVCLLYRRGKGKENSFQVKSSNPVVTSGNIVSPRGKLKSEGSSTKPLLIPTKERLQTF